VKNKSIRGFSRISRIRFGLGAYRAPYRHANVFSNRAMALTSPSRSPHSRLLVAVLTLAVSASSVAPVTAQSPTSGSSSNASLKHGKVKIYSGVILMGIGAVALPITAARSDTGPDGPAVAAGLACVGAGSALVWWGVQEQRRVLKPSTSIGVMVGRSSGIRIRRSW
jgi:hypothetical protein